MMCVRCKKNRAELPENYVFKPTWEPKLCRQCRIDILVHMEEDEPEHGENLAS